MESQNFRRFEGQFDLEVKCYQFSNLPDAFKIKGSIEGKFSMLINSLKCLTKIWLFERQIHIEVKIHQFFAFEL